MPDSNSVSGSSGRNVVLWFRRDLRLDANPALQEAASLARDRAGHVVALFVLDPTLIARSGANRLAFLYESLRSLRASGIPLVVRSGDPSRVVAGVAQEAEADTVVCAADFSPLGRERDARVATVLRIDGVRLHAKGSPYLVEPGTTRKDDGTPFKVFTPFRRVWERHAEHAMANRAMGNAPMGGVAWCQNLWSDEIPAAPQGASTRLPVASEEAAHDRLATFCERNLASYDRLRNDPAADATSRLSADLKFGLLHPAQILPHLAGGGAGPDVFRSELAWREFYADVLWHRPETTRQAFIPKMEAIEVDTGPRAEERFRAWCHGDTGYPFIDAGMRQLLHEGWMHNRVRMATASFLVKDLHIDWRRGAAWFMEQLVDGDVASNQHGWQWTAGTGTDAAPYFRIFNPIAQGRRFDPTGMYIRRHIPELSPLDDRTIHEPWTVPEGGLFGGISGYPGPIVDHAEERRTAMARYAVLKRTP